MIKVISAKIKKIMGFTLIEALVFLGISTLIISAMGGFLVYMYRGQNFIFNQALTISNAQKSMDKLMKEVREAMQSDSGAYLLEECGDYQIVFYSDIDKDNGVERVRYFLENEKFKKGVIESSGNPINYDGPEAVKTIASFVKNSTSTPLFYFFDKSFAGKESDLPLVSPVTGDNLDEVSMIGFRMKIDVNPFRAPKVLDFEAKVRLRNVK